MICHLITAQVLCHWHPAHCGARRPQPAGQAPKWSPPARIRIRIDNLSSVADSTSRPPLGCCNARPPRPTFNAATEWALVDLLPCPSPHRPPPSSHHTCVYLGRRCACEGCLAVSDWHFLLRRSLNIGQANQTTTTNGSNAEYVAVGFARGEEGGERGAGAGGGRLVQRPTPCTST
jgi:hypothetical protein